MFPYFGRKARLAGLYPEPVYSMIIEPFAGSMAYTFHHRPQAAIGIEKDHRVVKLFHDLASGWIPDKPVLGTTTRDLFPMLATYSEHSLTSTSMTVTSRMLRDWDSLIERARRDGSWARETVDYWEGDWSEAPDVEATWFIDPPYQRANRRGYRHGGRGIDFRALAEWCLSRRGQVIVCEQEGADWLPFQPLAEIVSHRGVRKSEMVFLRGTEGSAP